MKTFWVVLLILSATSLGGVLLKRNVPKGWLTRFGVHLVITAMALYALNFSGWVTGWYVPLNPFTIGTVALLGLPGIALVLGLQWTLLV
ncbi:pro-sigmaK processing inhibitor BofA family protein [Cohnella silvisoli]|uniref:Pro-sigmaK processing inhibitor BofA family protein n=1 Tax=Cohnella silvisoli TaxID=2873699 RepID=A0ABV1KRE9_9BACL|nr:pro-sigmaK processing inhibitor BofA family protein [Cohnella silvisoli]MCD9022379.1 pro-sigmaK processing inhibitor BofA family protein [Cohnella silvisoli]